MTLEVARRSVHINRRRATVVYTVKAKFHYASWFEAGDQLRTS